MFAHNSELGRFKPSLSYMFVNSSLFLCPELPSPIANLDPRELELYIFHFPPNHSVGVELCSNVRHIQLLRSRVPDGCNSCVLIFDCNLAEVCLVASGTPTLRNSTWCPFQYDNSSRDGAKHLRREVLVGMTLGATSHIGVHN
jgi:hypothetical protein